LGSVALAVLATALGWAPVAQADLETQAEGAHAALVPASGPVIRDDEFAALLKKTLLKNGTNSNVRDAKFLFQQCFGGGMLDDIQGALGNTVKWVGGAASKHSEESWGSNDEDYWTQALKSELAKTAQPLLDGINNATASDLRGPNGGTVREHGQSASGGGGETITLADTNATSHHAILWAGAANGKRHFNDIKNVRDALINAWGAPSATISITTLFGDGLHQPDGVTALPAGWNAQAATKANLVAVMSALTNVLNTNEQFFFYASDHGEWQLDVVKTPLVLPFGGTVALPLTLPAEIVETMRRQTANLPTIGVTYQGGPATVTLDGQSIMTLSSSQIFRLVSVSESLLGKESELRIMTSTSDPMTIQSVVFSAGVFNTSPDIQGRILLTGPTYTPSSNYFSFRISGEAGLDFAVESTTDFAVWSRFSGGIFQPGQNVQFQTPVGSTPRRFFRGVSDLRLLYATAGNHGHIDPPGTRFLPAGQMVSFQAVPDPGYAVESWRVNGVAVQSGGLVFNTTMNQPEKNINVTFQAAPGSP
jgi:hypothetical protein